MLAIPALADEKTVGADPKKLNSVEFCILLSAHEQQGKHSAQAYGQRDARNYCMIVETKKSAMVR
ncbi:MAG: hypothetical protein V4751_15200 [Pseudomonadota bacterium]